ncbi:hypothetical protein KR054_001036 [Drosophila jambulina]|nr:hypothetical protein KR054_001036 [Drosophila jambulina]
MALFPFIPSSPLFSPEGRLYEVEYAMEEVAKAVPVVAILAEDGIVVATEQEEDLYPLVTRPSALGHIFRVDNDNACAITGVMTDAFRFVSAMSSYSQRHRETYGELMPTERLVELICRKKQSYTMYTGKRPFGISVIYTGWDTDRGWQLYQSDPSGNYTGWRSVCIGCNAHRAQGYLNQVLVGKPLPALDTAFEWAIKALSVAMDGSEMSSSTVQVAMLQRPRSITNFQILEEDAVQELCNLYCSTA